MLKTHVRFIAQANKKAAIEKKKELITAIRSLEDMPYRYPFLKMYLYRQTSII